jgi:fermentation-respiration switch protein FrsA (DUF1100 family)
MSGVITIIVAIGAVYIGFAVLLYSMQNDLIYYPMRDIETTPTQAGMAYEDITFKTDDGLTLNGWFVPSEDAGNVLLFFHGNGGNISHRLGSIRLFHGLGLSVLIFDYRGYGQSEGKPEEQGMYRDAEAAWRYLVEGRGIDPARIILFGRSLGGSIATWLAQTQRPQALIIESTFTSAPDLAGDLYPFMPTRLLTRFDYNTRDYLSKVQCPVLIVHSRDDEIIPFAHGQELFQTANEPKSFLEIRGGHNNGFYVSGSDYIQGLHGFLARHLVQN